MVYCLNTILLYLVTTNSESFVTNNNYICVCLAITFKNIFQSAQLILPWINFLELVLGCSPSFTKGRLFF